MTKIGIIKREQIHVDEEKSTRSLSVGVLGQDDTEIELEDLEGFEPGDIVELDEGPQVVRSLAPTAYWKEENRKDIFSCAIRANAHAFKYRPADRWRNSTAICDRWERSMGYIE